MGSGASPLCTSAANFSFRFVKGLSPVASKDYFVQDSPLHGKGLFAKRHLQPGTLLGVCQVLPSKKEGLYTLTIDNQQLEVVCDLKYINHAKQANAIYWDDLSVEVIRPITKGDEITHDYGDEWD